MFLSQNDNHDELLEFLWYKVESVGMGVKYILVTSCCVHRTSSSYRAGSVGSVCRDIGSHGTHEYSGVADNTDPAHGSLVSLGPHA